MIGVSSASASRSTVLLAGTAGLVAGALSMAAGEYVSVSSQRDAEEADIRLERGQIETYPHDELHELAEIYEKRGLEPDLAMKVAVQLSAKDVLGSHLRDELRLDVDGLARPWLAALSSAGSFAVAALVPVLAGVVAPAILRVPVLAGSSLATLALLGAAGGYAGGAPLARAALRVVVGGAFAMGISAIVGSLLGVAGV